MRMRWSRGRHSGKTYSGSTTERTAGAAPAGTASSSRDRHWRSGKVNALLILLAAIASFDIGALMGGIASPVSISTPAGRSGPRGAYHLLYVPSGSNGAGKAASASDGSYLGAQPVGALNSWKEKRGG
ncbi:MAG: hypothetical protein ACYDGY_01415 [Acidimicrobiales bacterium]